MSAGSSSEGYSTLSIALHWLGAVFVIALFVTHEAARGTFGYTVHVGGGAIMGILLLWRVAHRVTRGMPERPPQPKVLNLLSQLVFWGFLVAIVVVVITGYFLPWSLGNAIDIFGIASLPSPMAPNRRVHELMEAIHDFSGHVFLPLLILHVLGTVKHAFIDKDGVARRMFRPVSGGH